MGGIKLENIAGVIALMENSVAGVVWIIAKIFRKKISFCLPGNRTIAFIFALIAAKTSA